MASQPTCSSLHLLLSRDVHDSVAGISGFVEHIPYYGCATELVPGLSAKQVAALALLGSIFKKCEDEQSENAKDACLLAFLESNALCGSWRVPSVAVLNPYKVIDGRMQLNPAYEGLDAIRKSQQYDAVKMCLADTFMRPTPNSLLDIPGFDGSNPFSWENIFLLGDVGPGAAIDASGGSWFDKFYQSPLTFTSEDLLRSFRSTLGSDTLRAVAEKQRADQYGYTKVVGGKFDSVLKSFFTERSIEIQPSINMWAQKGLATIMTHFIRAKYGVSLVTQQFINRELARRGSISGEIATVDLKEASNRIPWAMISDMLKSNVQLHEVLSKARVEYTQMPWGEYVHLDMCSTMGNGYTFALQTALFLAAVEACYQGHHKPFQRMPSIDVCTEPTIGKLAEMWVDGFLLKDTERYSKGAIPSFVSIMSFGCLRTIEEVTLPPWGVFGDDIIVPHELYPDMLYILEHVLGGTVNIAKSHAVGDFRESCGADWFNGAYVRPVYASSISTPQARVSLLNRLVEWSAYQGIPLRRTCRTLWASLPEKHKVPLGEMETAGLRVPENLAPKLPKTKAVLKEETDFQRKACPYMYWQARPEFRSFQGKQLVIFGPGILLGMIKGEIVSEIVGKLQESQLVDYIRRYKLGQRAHNVKYDTRWGVTYDWNARAPSVLTVTAMEIAVMRNLF